MYNLKDKILTQEFNNFHDYNKPITPFSPAMKPKLQDQKINKTS